MRTSILITIGLFASIFISFSCSTNSPANGNNQNTNLKGPYLGQQPPGLIPTIFAPSIISAGDWGITFSPDGRECFFTRSLSRPTIMTMKEEADGWTIAEVASFSGSYFDIEPHIVPAGNILYFGSERPLPGGGSSGLYQWMVTQTASGWSDPQPMNPPLRDLFMMYPSVADNGNMYFTASDGTDQWISMTRYVSGSYQEPVRLSENINSLELTAHPFIAPDESYIIFDAATGIQNNSYVCDLFISFRNSDGSWTQAVNMGNTINTDEHEGLAFVSRNNEYLFFYRGENIYWVDAGIIENFRL